MALRTRSITKRVDWSRLYGFDFTDMRELGEGQTLSGPVVTAAPSGLTLGTPGIVGDSVAVRISGGTAGVSYTIDCTVTTSGGSTLSWQGILDVV